MFFTGTDALLDIIAAALQSEENQNREISQQIFRCESEEHQKMEDIVRLPLKLPFPSLPLRSVPEPEFHCTERVAGPDGNEKPIYWGDDYLCGRSISTYPMVTVNRGSEKEYCYRDGDPICDRFLVELQPRRVIAVVADGCNWGEKPCKAARKASNAFVDYMTAHLPEATSTHYIARLITRAFSLAHHSILEGVEDLWEVGTTTLLGGVLVQLAEPLLEDRGGEIVECRWAYVWGCVGDCKGFHYSHRQNTFRDITSANRLGSASARDCGGRLGPAGTEGLPDLRNFRIDLTPCEDDDILILMSDGVHDNLEPLQIGMSPAEVNQGPEEMSWESMEPQKRGEIAADYSIYLLTNLVFGKSNGVQETPVIPPRYPESKDWKMPPLELFNPDMDDVEDPRIFHDEISCSKIVQRTLNHCLATNRNAAEFMQLYPTKKLPKDYRLYPGKMDHTTCMAFRVNENEVLLDQVRAVRREQLEQSNSSSQMTTSHSDLDELELESSGVTGVLYPSLDEVTSNLRNPQGDSVPVLITRKRTPANRRNLRASRSYETLPFATIRQEARTQEEQEERKRSGRSMLLVLSNMAGGDLLSNVPLPSSSLSKGSK